MPRLVRVVLKFGSLALLLSMGSALAQDGNSQGENQDGCRARTSSATWVPEFDPAAAGAMGIVVAGGGVLLARPRR